MRGLPVIEKKIVWRIGDPDRVSRPEWSLEGLGVSVSEHPEAWARIARLSGGTWSLRRKRGTGKFLDVYALSPDQVVRLTADAIVAGLLTTDWRWKAMWSVTDEDGEPLPLSEGYEYSFFENRERAELEAEAAAADDWAVRRERVALPTEKLLQAWSARFSGELTPMIASQVAWQVMLESSRRDLDGFWWDDELDPGGLSAPRGMIFYSRMPRWTWVRERRRNGLDDRLRRFERGSTAGDVGAAAALLMERVRAGLVDPWLVRAAVIFGHPVAVATGMPPLTPEEYDWTMGDVMESTAHGWLLFQANRGLEIEALDDPENYGADVQGFDGPNRDHDAHRFILERARAGDRTSIRALLAIMQQPGEVNYERAMVMIGEPLFEFLTEEDQHWWEPDLSPHYRRVADRVAALVESSVAASFLGLQSPQLDDLLGLLRRENERMPNPLEQRVECSWCNKKIRGSDDPSAPVSHGICRECRQRISDQVEAAKRGGPDRPR